MTPPKTRLGRPLLTRDAIVTAALEAIDAHGLEELSTRKLAKALGVEAMTLYHHFPTKGALLDVVAEHLVQQLDPQLAQRADPRRRRSASRGDPITQFVAGARALYALAERHPRAFPLLALRRANTPGAFAYYDALLQPLLDAGLSPADAALVFRATGYFALGAGLARVASHAQAADATPPVLEHPASLGEYPHLKAIAQHLTSARIDALFERGLRALAAGLCAEVGNKRRR